MLKYCTLTIAAMLTTDDQKHFLITLQGPMLSRFRDLDLPAFQDVKLAPDADVVPGEVLAAYALTNPVVTPQFTGSYNIHFKVEAGEGEFDLRRSNRPVSRDNLLYEAGLLRHLERKGFDLAPRIHVARDGAANVWWDGQGWTLFNWLGDGPKTVRQEATPERLANAARVLARLHAAGEDFQPEGERGTGLSSRVQRAGAGVGCPAWKRWPGSLVRRGSRC